MGRVIVVIMATTLSTTLCLLALITSQSALGMPGDGQPWHSLRPDTRASRHADEITSVPGFDGELPSRHDDALWPGCPSNHLFCTLALLESSKQ